MIAPFTSINTVYSGWIISLQQNWLLFDGSQQFSHNNPLWMIITALMYQLSIIVKLLFPTLFGIENNFLIRFLFKLPLLVTYIITAFLVEQIIFNETKNQEIAKTGFYFSLGNLPLFYTVAIWGSPEVLTLTFFSLAILSALKFKEQTNNKWLLILSGISFAISISFHLILGIFLLIFYSQLAFKDFFFFLFTLTLTFFLITVPWFLLSQPLDLITNNQPIGWKYILNQFPASQVIPIQFELWIIFFILFSIIFRYTTRQLNFVEKSSLLSILMLLLLPIASLTDFIIILQILLIYRFQIDHDIEITYWKYSIRAPAKLFVIFPIILLVLLMFLIAYPINEIFHISILQVSSISQAFQNINQITRELVLFVVTTLISLIFLSMELKKLLKYLSI